MRSQVNRGLDAFILQMSRQGRSYVEISSSVGLAPRTVKDRLRSARARETEATFDVRQPGVFRARRVCLSCDRPFLSEWIGHRRCDSCKERERRAAEKMAFA